MSTIPGRPRVARETVQRIRELYFKMDYHANKDDYATLLAYVEQIETERDFMHDIFDVFGFDYCDELFWRTDGEYAPLYVSVDCSDTFDWATADGEQFTAEDIPALRQAKADADAAGDEAVFPILWVARKRGRRPMRKWLEHQPDASHRLFDAAGPERSD